MSLMLPYNVDPYLYIRGRLRSQRFGKSRQAQEQHVGTIDLHSACTLPYRQMARF